MQQGLLVLLLMIGSSWAGPLHGQYQRQKTPKRGTILSAADSDLQGDGLQRRTLPSRKTSDVRSATASPDRTITASDKSASLGRPRQRPRYDASPSRTVAATRQGSQELMQQEPTRKLRSAEHRDAPRTARQAHPGLPPTPPRQGLQAQAQGIGAPSPKKIVGAKTLLRIKNQLDMPAFESLDQRLTRSQSRTLATIPRLPNPELPNSPSRPTTRSQSRQQSATSGMSTLAQGTPPRPAAVPDAPRKQRGIAVKRVSANAADEMVDNMAVPDKDNRLDVSGKIAPGRTIVTPRRVARLRDARAAKQDRESGGEN